MARHSQARPTSDSPAAQKSAKRSSHKRKVDWSDIENDHNFKGTFRIQKLKSNQIPHESRSGKRRKVDDEAKYGVNDDDEEPNKVERSPFDGTEIGDFYFRVEPSTYWLSTARYRQFTIQSAKFCAGDFVEVKRPGESEKSPWIAKVLEVRAGNESHVYLRVYWMYWPDETPQGKQPFHGRNELIASNHMDVIDATTVDDKGSVVRLVDNDNSEVLDPNQYYWRQTITFSGQQAKISALPLYCKDKKPHNPDEILIRCDRCENWLHGRCLEEEAVRQAYEKHKLAFPGEDAASTTQKSGNRHSSEISESTPNDAPSRGRKKKGRRGRKSNAQNGTHDASSVSPEDLLFSATLVTENGRTMITLTDKRPGQKIRETQTLVTCLLCGEIVDDSNADAGPSNGLTNGDIKSEPSDSHASQLPEGLAKNRKDDEDAPETSGSASAPEPSETSATDPTSTSESGYAASS